MTKAILIDAANREIREIEYSGTYGDPRSLQNIIGGYIELAWTFDNGDVLFVDEEGMFKPQRHFFRLSGYPNGRPFAGSGVIVGSEQYNKHGDYLHTDPPASKIPNLSRMVTFLDRAQADSWARGNASEPECVIYANGERTVITRTRDVWGAMPQPQTEGEN